MTDSLLGAIAATISAVEIGLLFLAGFAIFRSWGHTFAEAAAYALITTLMLLSCLFQIAFLIGNPSISKGAEVAFTILAAIMAYRLRRYLSQAWFVIRNFVSGHPVAGTVLLICFGYLATQAFLIPPDSIHWKNLGQVLRFQQHGTLFSAGFSTGDQAVEFGQALFPVNTPFTHFPIVFMLYPPSRETTSFPPKTDSVLFIYSNAELTFSVSF